MRNLLALAVALATCLPHAASAQDTLRYELAVDAPRRPRTPRLEVDEVCGTRVECLRREHDAIDLDGPAAATLIGLPVAVGAAVFGFYAMLVTFMAPTDEQERLWAGLTIGSFLVCAAAAVAGVWGLVRWMGGARDRRQLTREMSARGSGRAGPVHDDHARGRRRRRRVAHLPPVTRGRLARSVGEEVARDRGDVGSPRAPSRHLSSPGEHQDRASMSHATAASVP